MCWESLPRPDPQWCLRNWPVLVPALLHLFLPFIHSFDVDTIPQLGCWKSPPVPPLLRSLKGNLHCHSAAISLRLVIQLRINTKCISIFQAFAKWPAVSLGEETLWQEKCFPFDGLGHVGVDLQAVFQCLSSQTEQNYVLLSWQSRHGLISMFSNQTTFMFSQGNAAQLQGRRTINCNVAGKWRVQRAMANYTL